MAIQTRQDVWTIIHEVVAETVAVNGFDPDDIQPETLLHSELGLTSIDAIHVMLELEDRLGADIELEEVIIKDGEYVADLSVKELHDYVCEALVGAS